MSNKIVILASGTGSNAGKIIDRFRDDPLVTVAAVVSNRADAGALSIARRAGVEGVCVANGDIDRKGYLKNVLDELDADLVVLAGFLKKVPNDVVAAYPHRILNIHPALLPKYGGKGMYGRRVHEAVLNSGDDESGISIHEVNNEYDKGAIIFQEACAIEPGETVETLSAKVQALEHKYYPEVISKHLETLTTGHED